MSQITQQPYKTEFKHLSEMSNYIGKELGLSQWVTISQAEINTFAQVTDDNQWIHVNPEMSAQHSPFKKTVVHGFFVLSLIPKFCNETFSVQSIQMGINYGLDKVRFTNATRVDTPIRARVSLKEFTPIPKGAKYILELVFEIKGEEKPACIAEFIGLSYSKKT